MTELFAVRDRKGQLRAFTTPDVVKNNGAGYWVSTFNSKAREFVLDEEAFPEISWEDSTPTRLLLVNPQAPKSNVENLSLPGTIEVNSPQTSHHNVPTCAPITVFVDDISYIEQRVDGNSSILHMKNGDAVNSKESVNTIKNLIAEMGHEDR